MSNIDMTTRRSQLGESVSERSASDCSEIITITSSSDCGSFLDLCEYLTRHVPHAIFAENFKRKWQIAVEYQSLSNLSVATRIWPRQKGKRATFNLLCGEVPLIGLAGVVAGLEQDWGGRTRFANYSGELLTCVRNMTSEERALIERLETEDWNGKQRVPRSAELHAPWNCHLAKMRQFEAFVYALQSTHLLLDRWQLDIAALKIAVLRTVRNGKYTIGKPELQKARKNFGALGSPDKIFRVLHNVIENACDEGF